MIVVVVSVLSCGYSVDLEQKKKSLKNDIVLVAVFWCCCCNLK